MPTAPTYMHNDSLAAVFFKGHDYNSSLMGFEMLAERDDSGMGDTDPFMDVWRGLVDFFGSLPWVVYAIAGMVLLAWFIYLAYRRRMLWGGSLRDEEAAIDDNIYEIDYDREAEEARRRGDHAQLVRLVYLRTLRHLDETGRISWRIYKTPSQYAVEMHHDGFSRMTRHFQRVRYGRFGASPALYEEMKSLQADVMKEGGGQ